MMIRIITTVLLSMLLFACGEDKPDVPPPPVPVAGEFQEPKSTGRQPTFYGNYEVPEMGGGNWQRFSHLFEQDSNYLNEFELAVLPEHYAKNWWPASSFGDVPKDMNYEGLEVKFHPLSQEDVGSRFQYVHRYKCVYDPVSYSYANIAYPNPCNADSIAKARVIIKNTGSEAKTYYCRMFYQNTSYWYATGADMPLDGNKFLENYYGRSELAKIELAAGETKEVLLDYVIGKDPKGNSFETKIFYGPARAGAYEFMLWLDENENDPLLAPELDLATVNPFAEVQKKIKTKTQDVWKNMAFVPSNHFRFVTLNETFDGQNRMTPGEVYIVSDRDNKQLCDTCQGPYFKDVIKDIWTPDDFMTVGGFIYEAPFVKGDYGNRKENVIIDTSGVYFRVPKSTSEHKQKTWGELKFAPGFLYGTVKVVAKLAQVRNSTRTPTGIIHNIWLYQFRHTQADPIPEHPYGDMVNDKGKQPYEIDIEIWSKIYEESWWDNAYINYSIVDYMRDPGVKIKPGEEKKFEDGGEHTVDRFNNYQLNYPDYEPLNRDFFNDYHLYEIRWTPHNVTFLLNGVQKAVINWEMADIPDEYTFLWLGTLIYQDGTYYSQQQIPFYETTRFSHIRYISIE